MRAWRDPTVQEYLLLSQRVERYGVLPRAGGLDAQVSTDLEALDLIADVLASPMPDSRI
jgi:hypothetical protein